MQPMQVMHWEHRGDDSVCYFRGFAFTLSPDDVGTWLYVETDGPATLNRQFWAKPRWFPKTMLAHAFIRRFRKFHGI